MGALVDTDSSDYADAYESNSENNQSDSQTDNELDSQFLRTTSQSSSYSKDNHYHQTIMKRLKKFDSQQPVPTKLNEQFIECIQKRIDDYWHYDWYKLHPKLKDDHNLQILKNSMSSVYGRKSIIISLNVQYYEHNYKYLTEIGITVYDPRGNQLMMTPNSINIHIKIDDNQDLQNKSLIPNKSAYFNGKTSLLLNLDDAIDFVQGLIDLYLSIKQFPCCIIGHGLNSILDKLIYQGLKFPKTLLKYDTKEIFLLSGDEYTDASLMNALKVVNVPYAHLQNSGNDAYYTFLLATKLCDPDCREYYKLDDWQPEIVTDGGPTRKRKFSDKSIVIDCRSVLEAIDVVLGDG